jgi:pimeloyl-ACP methyl ester carboxylesterase
VIGNRSWRGPLGRLVLGWLACLGLVLLAVPVAQRATAAATGVRFLAELLSDGAWRWLSGATRPPVREPSIDAADLAAHVWRPAGRGPWPDLVLVHGLTPAGRDDGRLGWAAGLLAQTGFRVIVPDLPALRGQRLRPEDAGAVAAALRIARPPVSIVAVSVGARPAIAAAADPAVAARVRLVLSLGGYADARELVRHFTTGVRLDPALARAFLGLNLDLVRDPADRAAVQAALEGHPLPATAGAAARAVLAVLENRDPARVDALLAALPPETHALLDALSPARLVSRLPARLVVVHGRDDPAVPFTESRRLAEAADPRRTRLVLVDLFAHVEGRRPGWRQVRDLLGLWTAVYELLGA